MPQLERLILHDGIPIYSAIPLPGPHVVLSSLTELDISASVRDCMAVLAHIILAVTRATPRGITRSRR
jgi:hypothetical protein